MDSKISLILMVLLLGVGFLVGYSAFNSVGDLGRIQKSVNTLEGSLQTTQRDLREEQRRLDDSVARLEIVSKDLADRVDKILSRSEQLESKVEAFSRSLGNLSRAQERITTLETSLRDREESNARIQTLLANMNRTLAVTTQELADRRIQLEATAKDLDSSKEQVKNLDSKMTSLENSLNFLANDRLIVIELRKDTPSTRMDTKAYWENLRTLAAKADPSLALLADSVIARIDPYFDWFEAQPPAGATLQEFLDWLFGYSTSGAADYDRAAIRFQRESLLVVIIHIGLAVDKI